MIKCFVIEHTGQWRGERIMLSNEEGCPLANGHHHVVRAWSTETYDNGDDAIEGARTIDLPAVCACGYRFLTGDHVSHGADRTWRRVDTGEVINCIADAPVGAMWDATWHHEFKDWCGFDGHAWHVKTPGGDWGIDSRANNCTKPNDTSHRCWIREGEAPRFTVGKNSPRTCDAGAGSIQCGKYHGYLENGYLVENRGDARNM